MAKEKKIANKSKIKAWKKIFTSKLSLITLVIFGFGVYYIFTPQIFVGAILLIITAGILYLDYKEALKDN